jgi:hypothetical protein
MARLSKEQKTFLMEAFKLGSVAGADDKPAPEVQADVTKLYFGNLKVAETLTRTKPPFVITAPATKDANGNVATILTKAGVEEAEKLAGPKVERKPSEPLPTIDPNVIEIEPAGMYQPRPAARGRGAAPNPLNASIDRLQVGQSLFIPVSETMPEPWKRLVGTVQSATKRYNKEGSTDRRRFTVQEGEKVVGGVTQRGARIFRLADAKPGTSANTAASEAQATTVGANGPAPTATVAFG